MEKEDWQRIAKWIGYVYLPIVILAALVFIFVEWNNHLVSEYNAGLRQSSASTASSTGR